MPIGGTFSGVGCVAGGSMYSPEIAGGGTHMLTYTYTHPLTGCSASQIQYVTITQGNIASVEDVTSAANAIVMFPNPAITTLKLSGITKEIVALQIMDLLGKVVYTTTTNQASMNINVSDFPLGSYLIRFINADGISVTKRFMKTE